MYKEALRASSSLFWKVDFFSPSGSNTAFPSPCFFIYLPAPERAEEHFKTNKQKTPQEPELCRGEDSTTLWTQNRPFNQYLLSSVHDKPGKNSVVNSQDLFFEKNSKKSFIRILSIFQETFNQESIKYLMFLDKQRSFPLPCPHTF